MQHYLYEKGEYNPKDENSFAPALVNRIDRNTGGIVVAAKNAESLRILNEKFRTRELDKRYLCLVWGHMPKKEDTLQAYLSKNESQNRVYISDSPQPGGRTIQTRYRVLREKRDCSLLEIDLLTGRTHQIRAHMAHIGHPLLGDGKYGKNVSNRQIGFSWQALVSYRLRFAFTQEAGILEYLNGQEFTAHSVWFLPEFEKMAD